MRTYAVLCVVALACAVSAMRDDCCSVEDRHEVMGIWDFVWGGSYSGKRIAVAQEVLQDLFKHHPDEKALFANVGVDDMNSPKFKAECIRVINRVDVAINLLDDPATLDEQLHYLQAMFSDDKGFSDEFFHHLGDSFGTVMPQVASCFNPDAWKRCFNRIINGIHEE